ncbi:MAG: hypothetical protein QW561_03490 [Candidatus Aenigmatarchaeota archaeon]
MSLGSSSYAHHLKVGVVGTPTALFSGLKSRMIGGSDLVVKDNTGLVVSFS